MFEIDDLLLVYYPNGNNKLSIVWRGPFSIVSVGSTSNTFVWRDLLTETINEIHVNYIY